MLLMKNNKHVRNELRGNSHEAPYSGCTASLKCDGT